MGVSSLSLALSALWIGPFWGQDRSGTGPIVPARVSALWPPLGNLHTSFHPAHKPRQLWQGAQLDFDPALHPVVLNQSPGFEASSLA